MVSSFFKESPEDKVKHLIKKTEASAQKSDLRREWDARRANDPVEEEEIEPEIAEVDTFFTLGSDKIWVSEIQGPPSQIKGQIWLYDNSSVSFKNNLVVGWNSSHLSPLKTGMLLDSLWRFPNDSFKLGSFREEVIALQGTPDIIDGLKWSFGEALVEFNADTVVYWENDRFRSLMARNRPPGVAYTDTTPDLDDLYY